MSDHKSYQRWLEQRTADWEALCRNCGACCGATEDPCEHLRMSDKPGQYFCEIYEHRLGPHKTVSGREFTCVQVRNKLSKSWPGDERCGYKKVKR